MTRPRIDKDDLERHLNPPRRRACFEELGFDLRGRPPDAAGWVGHILGLEALGEGTTPSFSVNLQTGAVKDHGASGYAGDLYSVVMDVKGLSFPEALRWVADRTGYRPPPGPPEAPSAERPVSWDPFREGRVVTRYRYTDADGSPVYQVRRYEPRKSHPAYPDKTFRPFLYEPGHPKADDDGYRLGVPRALRALYRLPTVLEAVDAEEPVFVVEGERDADTLYGQDLAATTSGGATSWQDRFAQHLEGADVVVLPDSDAAGERYAKTVARSLMGVARTVRIVRLPGLPPGGDVSDWMASGGTVERLLQLADDAPAYTADAAAADAASAPAPTVEATKTQAERLLDYAAGVDLFHTPGGEAYATFFVQGVRQTAHLSSTTFRRWLDYQFYREEQRPPSSQARQDARDILAARALFEGPEREVHLRVAGHEGRIYIDLCNDKWQVVEIAASGWTILAPDEAPVRFRRTNNMRALPTPRRGASLARLRRHLRVHHESDFALILGYLVQALRPEGPYPGLSFIGEQGTAKSVMCEMIVHLIDPHHALLRARPRSERDLVIAAENAWMCAFDNMSALPEWISDALCRLSTGAGFATRKLYANREEEVFFACRPILLNGIDALTTRPDLADRSIIVELDPIPDEERRVEADVWAAFFEDWPYLLGALYEAVATALRRIGEVELERLPRMADFACWATAAEPAFPGPEGAFLDAYFRKREEASETAIETHTVAAAIRRMLEAEGVWTGKTSELLDDLRRYLPDPDRPPRDFPKNYQKLSDVLRRILPDLRAVGIHKFESPLARDRSFTLQMGPEEVADAADTAHEPPPAAPATPPRAPRPHPAPDESERGEARSGDPADREESDNDQD